MVVFKAVEVEENERVVELPRAVDEAALVVVVGIVAVEVGGIVVVLVAIAIVVVLATVVVVVSYVVPNPDDRRKSKGGPVRVFFVRGMESRTSPFSRINVVLVQKKKNCEEDIYRQSGAGGGTWKEGVELTPRQRSIDESWGWDLYSWSWARNGLKEQKRTMCGRQMTEGMIGRRYAEESI